jgi:alkaline phosphatase
MYCSTKLQRKRPERQILYQEIQSFHLSPKPWLLYTVRMKSSRQGRHHQKKQYSVMKVLFGSIMAIALAAALIGCSLGFGPEDSLPEGNIILFIGDGMGFAHVQAAARFHHGTDTGLSFQQFSVQTEMTTHAFGGVVTDSAAAELASTDPAVG